MANKGIKWKFNPPGASHFGGFYEALIKSSKRDINAVLGNADIRDEELLTAITGAEGFLNSRPLTYQSSDPKDEPVLTPNHFLHGQCGGQLAPETAGDLEIHPRRRWLSIQQLILEKMDPRTVTNAEYQEKMDSKIKRFSCWRHGNLF